MTRTLIKYAGYDPEENNFSGLEFPELRTFAVGSVPRKDRLDVEAVVRLRAVGMKHREIGEVIAAVNGRDRPYAADSVSNVLWKVRKKK